MSCVLPFLKIFGAPDCAFGLVIYRQVEDFELNKTNKIKLLSNDESVEWLTLARAG